MFEINVKHDEKVEDKKEKKGGTWISLQYCVWMFQNQNMGGGCDGIFC